MMESVIEKGVPMPRQRRTKFHSMEVGDSFLINESERERIHGLAGYYRRQHGMKFSVRKVADGVRVWRTA